MNSLDLTKRKLEDIRDPNRSITYGVIKPGPNDENGVLFIRSGDIFDGRINVTKLRKISHEKSNQYRRTILQGGELLVSLVGTPGNVATVPPELAGANIARQVGMVALSSEVSREYVKYYFLSHMGKAELLVQITGSVQTVINLADLRNVKVELPEIQVQKKIAGVLTLFDDLIELNLRRIQILEEIAQRVCNEWFVCFRFPGHENTEIVQAPHGSMPEGWENSRVKPLLKRLKAGRVYRQNNLEVGGIVPVIDQSSDEYLGFHNNKPDHEASPESPIIIFGDHTCKMQLLIEPFSIGPNVVPFVPKNDSPAYFVYFLVKDLVHTLEYKRHWTELNNKEVIVPPLQLCAKFAELVSPIFHQINLLGKKNLNLRYVRDAIMPKLISGETDVDRLDFDV